MTKEEAAEIILSDSPVVWCKECGGAGFIPDNEPLDRVFSYRRCDDCDRRGWNYNDKVAIAYREVGMTTDQFLIDVKEYVSQHRGL